MLQNIFTAAHLRSLCHSVARMWRVLCALLIPWLAVTTLRWNEKVLPDLYEASILELQAGLDSGRFSSVDLVQAYFSRIEEVNLKGPELRAVLELNPSALAQAKSLDVERKTTGPRTKLHGIPILLKDNIATVASDGMNTTAGSYALLDSIVPRDATIAAKLRKAGAILLGKANMSEWAHFRGNQSSGWSARGGQGTNPYYRKADPCGSSSGSGIATAIGLAAAAIGTETDGSIICPSSRNNLVGVKPTVGLTSRAGVIPISSHQDTIGPMTRSVSDAAIILSYISGRDSLDNATDTAPEPSIDYTQALKNKSLNGKRFGVPREYFADDTYTANDPSINVAFTAALETIRELGGVVVDPTNIPHADAIVARADEILVLEVDFKVQLAEYLDGLLDVPSGIKTLEDLIQFNHAHPELEEPDGYEDNSILMASETTTGYNSTYLASLAANYRNGGTGGIDYVLKKYKLDALLLPSEGHTTALAAITGYPIVTVPLGFLPENVTIGNEGPNTLYPAPGVPFGLAFIGSAYSEFDLIQYAYAYEQSTQTRLKRRAYAAAVPSTQLRDIQEKR